MRLRSQVYTPLGYNVQFPERIEGLNFDDYDSNALSLMIKHRKKLVGSFRIVLDSPIGIPSEKMYDFNSVRRKYRIAELSRLVVDEEHRSGSKEQGSKAFNELFSAAYRFGDKIGVDRYVMVMKAAHESRFLEFGGIEKIGETMYGNLDQDSSILLWDFNNVSEHFVDNVLNYKLREAA
jgi:N-acyl-L-homoserine lactone synthetase